MSRELADNGILSLTTGDCQGYCHHVKTSEEARYCNTARMTIRKWVPVATAQLFLRLRMEGDLQLWKVAGNILNKKSRAADKWRRSSCRIG